MHRADVEHPRDGLQHGGRRGEVQRALEQGGVPAARVDRAGDVEGEVVQAGQHAGLLQVVDAVGEDAARDEDQRDAGPLEERAEVDLQGPAVDEPAEQHRAGEADDPAEQRQVVAGAGRLGGGVEEDRGLEPLAADPEEGDQGDGERAEVEGAVELALELAGDRPRGGLHPEHHGGDEADRDDAREAADQLLGLEGQLPGAVGERRAEHDRQRDRGADAEPDVADAPGAVRLGEEGEQDDDDEGRLQALPQPDQGVADEHPRGSVRCR